MSDPKPKPKKKDVDAAYTRIEKAEEEVDAAVRALLALDSTTPLRRHMRDNPPIEPDPPEPAPEPTPDPVWPNTVY